MTTLATVLAVSLSLSSATNYTFTTPVNPQNIEGLGLVTYDGSYVLRTEDIAFLREAYAERCSAIVWSIDLADIVLGDMTDSSEIKAGELIDPQYFFDPIPFYVPGMYVRPYLDIPEREWASSPYGFFVGGETIGEDDILKLVSPTNIMSYSDLPEYEFSSGGPLLSQSISDWYDALDLFDTVVCHDSVVTGGVVRSKETLDSNWESYGYSGWVEYEFVKKDPATGMDKEYIADYPTSYEVYYHDRTNVTDKAISHSGRLVISYEREKVYPYYAKEENYGKYTYLLMDEFTGLQRKKDDLDETGSSTITLDVPGARCFADKSEAIAYFLLRTCVVKEETVSGVATNNVESPSTNFVVNTFAAHATRKSGGRWQCSYDVGALVKGLTMTQRLRWVNTCPEPQPDRSRLPETGTEMVYPFISGQFLATIRRNLTCTYTLTALLKVGDLTFRANVE